MATDFKTIESFWSLEEAEIARGFLESQGIDCQLDGRAIASNFWHLNVATGGVKLRTRQHDADRATALLQGIEHRSEFSTNDAADLSQVTDQPTELDNELCRTSPADEDEDFQFCQSDEDSETSEYGSILDAMRRQKWAIIVAFILLILIGFA